MAPEKLSNAVPATLHPKMEIRDPERNLERKRQTDERQQEETHLLW